MAVTYDKAWQLATLREGVDTWNKWRKEHPETMIDLSEAHLEGADLSEADLTRANLHRADLTRANLRRADLSEADLSRADLNGAHLHQACLIRAHLNAADLHRADLSEADLTGAELRLASLRLASLRLASLHRATLKWARLSGADLSRAVLIAADLRETNLSKADLSGADLVAASFVDTNLEGANLTDCRIFGVAAWNLQLDEKTVQANLCITPPGEPSITVDNLEVAQFLYVLLHNQKVRDVLDTIMSKVVLLLGRFGERKSNLDALREALRNHPNGYIPVLFDFEPQYEIPVLETVKTLANLSRFIIADLTDPNMVRAELTAIIPNVPAVPVQPILEGDSDLPTEYASWSLYKSFLPVYRYADVAQLLASLTETVIAPVEAHVQARHIVTGSQTE